MEAWSAENWVGFFSTVVAVGSLLFTAHSVRAETKSRRVGNRIALTENHRELFSELLHNPKLRRVLDASPDLAQQPVTRDESIWVNLLIQHLGSAFDALNDKLSIKPEGLQQDIREVFSLAIPRAIWDRIKPLQNDDFVEFVHTCLAEKSAEKNSPPAWLGSAKPVGEKTTMQGRGTSKS